MAALIPVALYGLEVPPGEILVPVSAGVPATIRITMAAIDPTEETEEDADSPGPSTRQPARSTLKLVKQTINPPEEDESDEDDDELRELLLNGGFDSDEDDEDDDDDDAAAKKSKKARQTAALKQLLDSAQDEDEEESDEEMEDAKPVKANGINGHKGKGKGKGKETLQIEEEESDEEESDEDEDDELAGLDMEQFVICTLDTDRNYQQTIEITVGESEKAFFVVSGTHTIHLTGNYVIDPEEASDGEDEDEDELLDYDLPPGIEDIGLEGDDESEEDELDGLGEVARIKEVDTDDEEEEEEAPKLVPAKKEKNSKKRPAEDEKPETNGAGLDDLIEKDAKLSKKQAKKLKNNEGKAAAAPPASVVPADELKKKEDAIKNEKKVQFAKNLEQGPSGSAVGTDAKKPTLGVKVVQGVTIDDRKLGSGRIVKKGDKVAMRYIGKLADNNKVFDSNKKGPPFTFQVGKGEVIKGWDIGIAGMAVKGERRLTIPANLAYGNKGTPGIPGNATLVFDVKLVEIK